MTISEYFSSNPQVKWAAFALLGVYLWFMVLGPMFNLFTHDKEDKTLSNSRSRWFLQVLMGIAPLVYLWYTYSNVPPPPPPEPPQVDFNEFSSKISTVTEKLMHPQVYYIPYPSTAQPVPPPSAPPAPPAPEVPKNLSAPPAPPIPRLTPLPPAPPPEVK